MANWRAVREKIEAQPGLCGGHYYKDGACCAVGALAEKGQVAGLFDSNISVGIGNLMRQNTFLRDFFKEKFDLDPQDVRDLQSINDRNGNESNPKQRRAKVIEWLHEQEAK